MGNGHYASLPEGLYDAIIDALVEEGIVKDRKHPMADARDSAIGKQLHRCGMSWGQLAGGTGYSVKTLQKGNREITSNQLEAMVRVIGDELYLLASVEGSTPIRYRVLPDPRIAPADAEEVQIVKCGFYEDVAEELAISEDAREARSASMVIDGRRRDEREMATFCAMRMMDDEQQAVLADVALSLLERHGKNPIRPSINWNPEKHDRVMTVEERDDDGDVVSSRDVEVPDDPVAYLAEAVGRFEGAEGDAERKGALADLYDLTVMLLVGSNRQMNFPPNYLRGTERCARDSIVVDGEERWPARW